MRPRVTCHVSRVRTHLGEVLLGDPLRPLPAHVQGPGGVTGGGREVRARVVYKN